MTGTVQKPKGGLSLRVVLGSSQCGMMFLGSLGLSEAQDQVEGSDTIRSIQFSFFFLPSPPQFYSPEVNNVSGWYISILPDVCIYSIHCFLLI